MEESDNKKHQRVRRPAFISKMTASQKRELVKIAIDMAMQGDFSGIAAMAEVEKLKIPALHDKD